MIWGQNEWLWLIGIFVAGLISWYFGRRYGTRRRKLLFTWDALQLMRTNRAQDTLVVSYEGNSVEDPYIVQITVKNIGPVDISSSDFDAARDLSILLPKGYLTVVDSNSVDVIPVLSQSPDGIYLKPVLLRRGASISLDVLVDGNPDVQLDSPLINTAIVSVDPVARAAAALNQSADPFGFLVGFVKMLIIDSRSSSRL